MASAVAWLQAAAQDAANSSSSTTSSRSGSTPFPDQVLVSQAAGYALLPRSSTTQSLLSGLARLISSIRPNPGRFHGVLLVLRVL
jgi:hypothetical protein